MASPHHLSPRPASPAGEPRRARSGSRGRSGPPRGRRSTSPPSSSVLSGGAGEPSASLRPPVLIGALRYPQEAGRWGRGQACLPPHPAEPALLLLEVKPGSEPPAFRSSNTALSSQPFPPVGAEPRQRAGGGCVVAPAPRSSASSDLAMATARALRPGRERAHPPRRLPHLATEWGRCPSTTPSRRSRPQPTSWLPPRAPCLLSGVERELHVVPCMHADLQSRTTPWSNFRVRTLIRIKSLVWRRFVAGGRPVLHLHQSGLPATRNTRHARDTQPSASRAAVLTLELCGAAC